MLGEKYDMGIEDSKSKRTSLVLKTLNLSLNIPKSIQPLLCGI